MVEREVCAISNRRMNNGQARTEKELRNGNRGNPRTVAAIMDGFSME